jgi:excisionase family DNA binding protein
MHTDIATLDRIGSDLSSIDPWLTLRQGAAHAQADEVTLRREIRRGRLRAARIGGRKCFRLRRSWIDEWLERTSTPIEVRS